MTKKLDYLLALYVLLGTTAISLWTGEKIHFTIGIVGFAIVLTLNEIKHEVER